MSKPIARRLLSRTLTSLVAIGAVSFIFAAKAMDAEHRLAQIQELQDTAREAQHAALP